jgi:hypothetical protein
MSDTQAANILHALKSGRAITPICALTEFGCFRLAARILDLRRAGHSIETVLESDGQKRWAKYSMTRSRS